MTSCNIAIIGAGPYGLSAAAHLNAAGIEGVRVFGECMSFWERHMPTGMLLRSPWAASHLSDPRRQWSLEAYRSLNGNHLSPPVPLSRFVDYGRWFQKRAVPNFESRKVATVQPKTSGFELTMEDGERIQTRRVIVAGGILPFTSRPAEFKGVSPELASHSSEHRDLSRFKDQRIVVIGGGQSALESAALLHEAGAGVEVLVRAPIVRWLHQKPILHTWPISAMLYAWPDVGPAVTSHIIARPNLFRRLPRDRQDLLGPRAIRAAGAAWLKPRCEDVRISTGRSVKSAQPYGDEMKLTLDDGSTRQVHHVLLATGYRVDIRLYPFLPEQLLKAIRHSNGYPVLNAGFESSIPGLHFVGAPAAWSFGPLMRFVAGASFASRSLASRIPKR